MIKVECESCKASYEVDPRRIPPGGMKMRCPKCGISFTVKAPAADGDAALPPPLSIAQAEPPPPAGQAPVEPKLPKGTLLGQPAAGGAPPLPPPIPAETKSPKDTASGKPFTEKRQETADWAEVKKPPRSAFRPASTMAERMAALKISDETAEPTQPVTSPGDSGTIAGIPVIKEDASQKPEENIPPGLVDLSDLKGQSQVIPLEDLEPPDLFASEARRDQAVKSDVEEASFADLEPADLPAPKTAAEQRAIKQTQHEVSFADLEPADLPALKTAAEQRAIKQTQHEVSFADLEPPDLPMPKAGKDQKAAKATQHDASFEDLGLPDLPVPKGIADLPAAARDRDGVRLSGTEQPDVSPAKKAVTPPARPSVALPKRALVSLKLDAGKAVDEGFGELDLPVPRTSEPARSLSAEPGKLGEVELPVPKAVPPPPPPRHGTVKGVGGIGDAKTVIVPEELQPPSLEQGEALPPSRLSATGEADFTDMFGQSAEAAPPPPPPSESAAVDETSFGDVASEIGEVPGEIEELRKDAIGRSGLGSASFGEVDLGGAEEKTGSEMEFGLAEAPVEMKDESAIALPPEILRRQRGAEFEAKQQAASRKTLAVAIKVAVGLLVLALAGMALGLTEHGIFGMYYFEQYLPAAATPAFAQAAIRTAEKIGVTDTYADVRALLRSLALARKKASLNRPLLARSLFHESLYLIRFGQDSASSGRAAAILTRLEERGGIVPGMALARSANALYRRELPKADSLLQAARREAPSDPYVALLMGELALRQSKLDAAEKAFGRSLDLGGEARAQWGLTRVLLKRDQSAAAIEAIDKTLEMSPLHADAMVAKARFLIKQGKEPAALKLLQEAIGLIPLKGGYLETSKMTQAGGFCLLGHLHETRGRLPLASQAYGKALEADPYLGEAMLGSARVALREHRLNDALIRFESALNISRTDDPVVLTGRLTSAEAELGIGRSLLALDRVQEGLNRLSMLASRLPRDSEIILWLGRALQAAEDYPKAEEQYRKAIELKPDQFEGYLALAQLLFKQSRADEATVILNKAAGNVPESAEMRRMLGQSELSRNHLETAIREFRRAVELDPEDMEARFGLGVALRRSGGLYEAQQIFQLIQDRDPAFAGLYLEQGLINEAQGKFNDAIERYNAALKNDPKNVDLLLRLGAAQVEANNLTAAQQTLEQVISQMPNSAEAEYFIGRIALAQDRTPDALIHFDRAINLDSTRAEFHLYAGMATFQMGNLGRTLQEAQAAMNIDSGQGDAYRLRGMVRLRTGAVQDALEDLETTIRLRPSRYEAYAAMGDCQEQLRNLPAAILSYRKALDHNPKNGQWWYRLGSLQLDTGGRSEGVETLNRAIKLGEEEKNAPFWLPDAYRMMGESMNLRGDRKAAINYFQQYLKVAPLSALDRETVIKTLRNWGVDIKLK